MIVTSIVPSLLGCSNAETSGSGIKESDLSSEKVSDKQVFLQATTYNSSSCGDEFLPELSNDFQLGQLKSYTNEGELKNLIETDSTFTENMKESYSEVIVNPQYFSSSTVNFARRDRVRCGGQLRKEPLTKKLVAYVSVQPLPGVENSSQVIAYLYKSDEQKKCNFVIASNDQFNLAIQNVIDTFESISVYDEEIFSNTLGLPLICEQI